MDIKSCVLFTELGRIVVESLVFYILFYFYFMDAYLNDMDLRQSSLVQIVNYVTCFEPTDTH